MELCRRALRGRSRTFPSLIRETWKPACCCKVASSYASEFQAPFTARTFASVFSKWQSRVIPAFPGNLKFLPFKAPLSANLLQQKLEAFDAQQVRHVYVEVIDNDIDGAIKVYRRKMRTTKVEEKLTEKRFHVKASERRKLAKHYKKLNRARRELNAKLRMAKNQMETIREVRRKEKQVKREKAAEAALAAAAEVVAKAKASQKAG